MKNRIVIIVVLALLLLASALLLLYPQISSWFMPEGDTDEVVQTADFVVYDEQMNKVNLSDYFGKPIVVNFWATWCPPCRSELPAFDEVAQKYKGEVVFLMVNLEPNDVSGVKSFIQTNGYAFPPYFDVDNDAVTVYQVESIPQTLFINADGSLYASKTGAMTKSTLESYVTKLLQD